MDLAHMGVIVPNLEVGRDRLNELLGVEWGPVSEAPVPAGDGESRESGIPFRGEKRCW
jgi:hypothetical protein